MKLTFDKAILWLLPYLYLLSILYYWGYWGTFNIDVFNYYAVSDLVKGIISPLRNISSTLLVITIALFAVEWLGSFVKTKTVKVGLILSLAASVPLFLFLLYGIAYVMGSHPDPVHPESLPVYLFLSSVWFYIAARLAMRIYGGMPETFDPIEVIRILFTICLIVFPSRVFFNAKNEALLIKQNKEFNYIIADSLVGKGRDIYKYLGKVGDSHILLTRDNSKSIIVPTSKIVPLVIESVSLADSASMRRYTANRKSLLTLQVR